MPITSPRRRLPIALTVGAIVALSALAMPTAASAAEVCVTGTTPTAETQPWQTFAESPNQFVLLEAAYDGILDPISSLLGAVDADFTQPEYDTLAAAVNVAFGAGATTANAATTAFGVQETALQAGLLAADPAHQAENQALMDSWGDAIDASQYGAPLNTTFTTYLTQLGDYLTAVQAAITAATPVPTVPLSFTDASAALGAGIDGIGAYVQTLIYDGAAAQVVLAQTCTAALAATGSTSEPAPMLLAAALMLLVGAGVVVATKRREVSPRS